MVKTEIIFIPNNEIEIEAEFYESKTNKDTVILLCHPDPRMGGNFHNNVISGVFNKSMQKDVSCLRFNFRGVGRSSGKQSNGRGELSDVKACVDYLIKEKDIHKIFICGYSFGAVIGCAAINYSDNIIGYASISLPFDTYEKKYEKLSQSEKPKYFLQGDRDSFIPLSTFDKYYYTYQDPKSFKIINGANHFYWSYEELLANEIISFYNLII